jgi:malate synthase
MDEILWELRERSAGLNAGRRDYIFSVIKKLGGVLPDRAQVTMTVPFMRAYTELLVATCHQRGAHAIGGTAAFIPSRRDPAINEAALAKVNEDRVRESGDGFDGTGSRTPISCRSRRTSSIPFSTAARVRWTASATTSASPPSSCSTSRFPAVRSRTTGSARTSPLVCATSTPG